MAKRTLTLRLDEQRARELDVMMRAPGHYDRTATRCIARAVRDWPGNQVRIAELERQLAQCREAMREWEMRRSAFRRELEYLLSD